jgi:hypothetical protein
MIRLLRATDALAIGAFLAHGAGRELAAETWPRTPPEARRPGFLGLTLGALFPARHNQTVGIARGASGRISGLVLARARAGGMVWDVEHVRTQDAATGVELLRWIGQRALAVRARRVFIDTPDEASGSEVASRARFERYSDGTTYRLSPGFSRDAADTVPARPRLGSDDLPLFQLYSAAVPANVRAAEAMTHEEWAALYPGRKLWTPAILGNRQDYVWEMGSHVAAWMRVVYGQRAQFLDLLIHPSHEAYAERMVRYALVQMSTKAPVVIDVREYQGALRVALEKAGFQPVESYAVWVLQLAERVAEPSIAAAQVPA